MWPLGAILTLASVAFSYPFPHLRRAEYVTSISGSYDFVIAGGGLAGLVLASRLSEDSNTTVLVIEAGDTGQLVQDRIDVPGNAYYDGLIGTTYDWAYTTVSQPNAGNRQLSWPRGKVLGGSSAVNGMFLVYPSEIEINAWRDLIAPDDSAAADAWGWDQFSAAMRKAETFTAPLDAVKSQDDIQYNAASHGSSGLLHSSYPGYSFSVIGDYINSLNNVGVPPCPDGASGQGWGAYVTTSAINAANWTRSYSRSAYIDPLPPRPNLTILVNSTVTQILFSKDASSGNLTATGVQYATASGASAQTVNANKEVILSAGAIGSPQLLMVSGIGPSDVLQAAGISIEAALPGVGQHLQDHLSTPIIWNSSYQTAGAVYASGSSDASTSQFLSYINSATSYINLTAIFGDDTSSVLSNITSYLDTSASPLAPSTDPEVLAGYRAIYNSTANVVLNSPVGAIEMILNLASAGSIGVIVALQHPLSQGRLYVNSSSVFDYPLIDPNYFSHPTDKVIFREALKLARTLGATAPLSASLGSEIAPGSSVVTDADWDNWYVNQVTTEYHPGGTCAMLPQSQGGVVNAKLQVYGTTNLRVIDSSVYPISFSAHFMMLTYGLAEQAADIIRAQYNGINQSSSSSNNGSVPASSSTQSSNGASSFASSLQTTLWTLLLALGLLFAL